MNWSKLFGFLMQLASMYMAMTAGEHSVAAKLVPQGDATIIAGQPVKTYGYGGGALGLLTVGAGLTASGTKKKKDTVVTSLREIAADAAETGDIEYQKKVADLAFSMQARRKSTVKP